MIDVAPQQRSRNAAATRLAILAAARRQFACESFENVGLREIAREVGVDPSLVCRYFGGKEELFREVLQHESGSRIFDGVEPSALPAYFVSLILDEDEDSDHAAAKLDKLLIILRSASSLKASAIVRESIDEDIIAPLAARLGTPDGRLRATLALTVLLGSGIVRKVMFVDPICQANRCDVHRHLLRLFESALSSD